ncbi:TPA: hypothetical protein ACGR2T_003088, partial [Escherichia coli]
FLTEFGKIIEVNKVSLRALCALRFWFGFSNLVAVKPGAVAWYILNKKLSVIRFCHRYDD